jgi:hypothetical protein
MGNVAALDFGAEPPGPSPAAETPQVFVRTFTIPSGLPWDQARAAQLEARHGAPLPIADLVHRLRRLEPWAPGRIGRYAVFYVRRRDYSGPFETTIDVDGQTMRVAFGSRGLNLQRYRAAALAVCTVAAAGLAIVAMAVTVLGVRDSAEQQLTRLERESAVKLRIARAVEAGRQESRELAMAQGQSGRPTDVLDDIAWVARNRTSDARIVALHWDHGLLAVEARGELPPLGPSDRQMVRAQRPVRPGVWAWGVSRRSAATPAPVAAALPGGGP